MRGKAGVVCAILCGITALALPGLARADIGIQGPAYAAGTSGSPSGSKPESKLWSNDGFWWASMFDPGSGAYRIFKLVGPTWTNTGPTIDTRNSTRQDVLWDGSHLWIASHKFQETTAFSPALENAADPLLDSMHLYRFSYNPATDTYIPDPGFPVRIDPQRSEALVIDRASDGKIWATWVQQEPGGAHRVFTRHTNGDCGAAASGANAACGFTSRAPIGSAVSPDDISSLIRVGGNIGIMWSDQLANAMRFVVVSPPATFGSPETAISGPKQADDHINLKTAGGKIYAATKTKFASRTALHTQTRLLVRDASGTWTSHTISFSPERRTRPIVALDTQNGIIHVFETGPHPSGANPESGGSIFESTSDLNSINFAVLSRRPVIEDSDSPGMNNATSTKQNVNAATDLVVLATNVLTRRYWHHFEAISATAPPPPGGGGGACTIRGTTGGDIIKGTARADVICGLGGADIIRGFGGRDRLLGGPGNDLLLGGPGADRLLGQLGNDRLLGGAANDGLAGGTGRDRLVGGLGRDNLGGWIGNDTLVGGPGKDRFIGGRGRDTLFSRDRVREVVNGGPGRDRARVNLTDIRRSIERLF
jgi:RTX calcium-binding nonapeptide repeat (4 copies)